MRKTSRIRDCVNWFYCTLDLDFSFVALAFDWGLTSCGFSWVLSYLRLLSLQEGKLFRVWVCLLGAGRQQWDAPLCISQLSSNLVFLLCEICPPGWLHSQVTTWSKMLPWKIWLWWDKYKEVWLGLFICKVALFLGSLFSVVLLWLLISKVFPLAVSLSWRKIFVKWTFLRILGREEWGGQGRIGTVGARVLMALKDLVWIMMLSAPNRPDAQA